MDLLSIKTKLLELEGLKKAAAETDSKKEERELKEKIYQLECDVEGEIYDFLEDNIPDPITITVKFEKKLDIEYWEIDDGIATDLLNMSPENLDNINIKDMVLKHIKDLDLKDFIDDDDINVSY